MERNVTQVMALSLAVAILALLALSYFFYSRPPQLQLVGIPIVAGGPEVTLVIHDDDTAVWMAENNTFTYQGGNWVERERLWHGVVFQLGKAIPYTGGQPASELDSVTLHKNDGSLVKTISEAEFSVSDPNYAIWINIVARGSQAFPSFPPMSLADLPRQFPIDTNTGKPKSLHKYFEPFRGGITLWENRDNGLSVKSGPQGLHRKYTFTLAKEANHVVEVFKGRTPDGSWTDVTSIEVHVKGGPNHGPIHNPPQKP